MRPVFRIVKRMLFIVPPVAVRAGATASGASGAERDSCTNHRFGRGESGYGDHRLTRSNHKSYAVMSGERIVQSVARGGFLSAHRNTKKSFQYLEVLVRVLCS
jgi:hypothetical protein